MASPALVDDLEHAPKSALGGPLQPVHDRCTAGPNLQQSPSFFSRVAESRRLRACVWLPSHEKRPKPMFAEEKATGSGDDGNGDYDDDDNDDGDRDDDGEEW